jgi:nicotinamide riboside transporter PnuC
MDLLSNIVGCISLITTVIGMYYVSKKIKTGFIYYSISLIAQLILFILISNWFLVLQMVVLLSSNVYIYWKWRKDDVISNN